MFAGVVIRLTSTMSSSHSMPSAASLRVVVTVVFVTACRGSRDRGRSARRRGLAAG